LTKKRDFTNFLRSYFLNEKFLIVWVLAAVWWVGTQYLGAEAKDGLLYSGEAIRQLHPKNFVQDPFFMDATQGNYTIFGKIYGQLILWLGIYPAGFTMSVVGRILWCIGAICAAREIRSANGNYLASLALIFLLPSMYDGLEMLGYGEVIVTSRCWAEALLLLALSAQLRGNTWLSSALALSAASLHPLMALTGWLLLIGLQKPRVRHICITLGIFSFCALAIAQVSPFTNIWKTYDPLWWQRVSDVNYYVLAKSWPVQAYSKMLGWMTLLIFSAYFHPEKRLARLARILAWTYLLLILVWIIGCQIHNVLLMQLQTWRILWLVQLLAPALWISSLPPIREWDWRIWAHATLTLVAILSSSWGISLAIVPAVLFLTFCRHYTPSPFLRWTLILVPWIALLMILPARYEFFFIRAYANGGIWYLPLPFLLSFLTEPILILPLLIGGAVIPIMHNTRVRLTCLVICTLALTTLCSWYFLFQIHKATKPVADVHRIQQIIPPGAVIYWREDVKRVWLNLQRAHYAGPYQGAGTIFSHQTALEFYRRIEFLQLVDYRITGLEGLGSRTADMNRSFGVSNLCSDPVLDFVILNGHDASADYYVPYTGVREQEVSIVNCKKYRK